jgi:alpha-aminoadipate/glutamate carrier protein LysW
MESGRKGIVIPIRETTSSEREEAAVPTCPECENNLDIEMDEVEEGDVVACEECGTEYEIVGVEPLELTRVGDELDDEDELLDEEEEEEE